MIPRRALQQRGAVASSPGGPPPANLFDSLPAHAIGTDWHQENWNPAPWQDLTYAARGGFRTLGSGGEGPAVTVDSNGFPTVGNWGLKLLQTQGRGNAPTFPTGAWQIIATPRTPGTPGTWSLASALNCSLTGYSYDAGTNEVTATLNITSTECIVLLECTEAVSNLRVLAPGVSPASTSILRPEAREWSAKFATYRTLNISGQNSDAIFTPDSFATLTPHGSRFGQAGKGMGWGAIMSIFSEIHNAPNSSLKFLSVNMFYKWDSASGDYTSFVQLLKNGLPSSAGLIMAGVNEEWNDLYPHPWFRLAQVRGATTYNYNGTDYPCPAMSRADRIRVCAPGAGTAWKMVTASVTASGSTTAVIAAGGEGSLVVGDTVRFLGYSTWHTCQSAHANVAGGVTVTFSPPTTEAVPAGTVFEKDPFADAARWWALKEARAAQACKDVWGTEFGNRCVYMLQTHMVNPSWHTDYILPFLARADQVAEFGAVGPWAKGIGGAPYPTLSEATMAGLTTPAQVINALRTSTAPNDTSMAVIAPFFATWNNIKNTYGIQHQVLYEFNAEHLGFGTGALKIATFRDAAFKTYADDYHALIRANGIRLMEALTAMPTSYSETLLHSHWGFVDAQIATTVAEAWSFDTGRRAQSIKDHMITTGQW